MGSCKGVICQVSTHESMLPSLDPIVVVCLPEAGLEPRASCYNVGASTIACTILGVPNYNYSLMGPKTLSNF